MKKILVILFPLLGFSGLPGIAASDEVPPFSRSVSECSEIPFDGLFNPESPLAEQLPPSDPETSRGREGIALKIGLARKLSTMVCGIGFKCDRVSDVMFEGLRGNYSKSTLWCNRRSLVYVLQLSGSDEIIATCVKGACRGKQRNFNFRLKF